MRRSSLFAALLALAPAPACLSLRPPAESSGPALAREGTQVAVTRQRCSETVEPEQPGNDLVEEVVEVQVRNAASTPLTVHRDAFRLVTPEGYALATSTLGAADPLTLAAGETRAFELRFMTRGSLACAREMRLLAGRALVLRDGPVEVGPVRFIPEAPLAPA